jgi:hypothetical protein
MISSFAARGLSIRVGLLCGTFPAGNGQSVASRFRRSDGQRSAKSGDDTRRSGKAHAKEQAPANPLGRESDAGTPDLPQKIRDKYKQAMDHAEVSLMLWDAIKR